jgi:hypothetical protein
MCWHQPLTKYVSSIPSCIKVQRHHLLFDDVELPLVNTCNSEVSGCLMVVSQLFFMFISKCLSAVNSFLALPHNVDLKCHSFFYVAFRSSIDVDLHALVG